MELTSDEKKRLMYVARGAIRGALGMPAAEEEATAVDSPNLKQLAGCFVSLHDQETHRLRGCVGRLDANEPLMKVVDTIARSTLEDPRFVNHRVKPEDLSHIQLEVSVLSPLRRAANAMDFDPARDGIYLTFGDRAGCFLPQVAREMGWGKEELLDRLCTEKLGMAPITWQHPEARLQIFSTITIGPESF